MVTLTSIAKRLPAIDRLVRRPPVLYRRLRAQLVEEDELDLDERLKRQAARLEKTIERAKRTPHYNAMSPVATLEDIPLLDKATLRDNHAAFRPRRFGLSARAVTSGSTGVPLVVRRSPYSVAYEQATIDHLIARAGFDPLNARILTLRPDVFKHPDDQAPPYWWVAGRSRAALSAQHLNEKSLPHFANFIREFRPDFLLAYAGSFDLMLRLLEQGPTRLQIPLVVTSCEVPAADLRKRAAEQLGALMLDYYGQAERVACAHSLEDGEYWFRPDYGAVEFVPGETGIELVATGLRNSAQFLLRYRTGDFVETSTTCDPASLQRIAMGVEPFIGISGRSTEYLILRDGSRIVGLNHIVRDLHGIASTQIIQKDYELIDFIVVPGIGFDETCLDGLRQRISMKIPSCIHYKIRISESPYRTQAGKAPLFHSQLGGPS